MASLSFTVDWEQGEKEGEVREDRSRDSSHDTQPPGYDPGMAWEINFSSDSTKPKRQLIPKFLREREKRSIPHADQIKGSPSGSRTNIIAKRSSSSPQTSKGAKAVSKSHSIPLPSKSADSSPTKREELTKKKSLSPKKLPTIKKPLLPVSPTIPIRSPDLKSHSETILLSATSSKTFRGQSDSATSKIKARSHSASPRTRGDITGKVGRMRTSPQLQVSGHSTERNAVSGGNVEVSELIIEPLHTYLYYGIAYSMGHAVVHFVMVTNDRPLAKIIITIGSCSCYPQEQILWGVAINTKL